MLQEKTMKLEQTQIEQKQMYQGLLKKLEDKYHNDISFIRNKYEARIKDECARADQAKLNILEGQKKVEYKLFELEQENQLTLQDLQMSKDGFIAKLKQTIQHLETKL